MNHAYIPALDGVRALAVLAVMLFHFHQYPFGIFGLDCGWAGVQLFFVLSGFLITRILLQEKHKPLGGYLKRFYWRRTLRIFPIYFAYLSGMGLLFVVTGQPESFGKYAVWLFTYSYNFSRLFADWQHSPLMTHLWSLCVEEQFYIVWPFVVYFSSDKGLKRIVAVLWWLCPLLRGVLAHLLQGYLLDEAVGEAVYWFTLSHLDAFATGAAIHLFGWQNSPHAASRFWGLLLLLLATGLANYSLAPSDMRPTSLGFPAGGLANGQAVWSYTLLNFTFAAFLALLIRTGETSMFARPLLIRIGQVSYGMYMYHWAVLGAATRIFPENPQSIWVSLLLFIAYAAVVYAAARMSFYGFELRFLRWKHLH